MKPWHDCFNLLVVRTCGNLDLLDLLIQAALCGFDCVKERVALGAKLRDKRVNLLRNLLHLFAPRVDGLGNRLLEALNLLVAHGCLLLIVDGEKRPERATVGSIYRSGRKTSNGNFARPVAWADGFKFTGAQSTIG